MKIKVIFHGCAQTTHIDPSFPYLEVKVTSPTYSYCLSNALHSSIGQNIKSHTCPLSVIRYPLSGLRYPFSGQSVKKKQNKTSNGHNSATRHPIYFVFGSRLVFLARIALFNLTARELHELYYDRPTS